MAFPRNEKMIPCGREDCNELADMIFFYDAGPLWTILPHHRARCFAHIDMSLFANIADINKLPEARLLRQSYK